METHVDFRLVNKASDNGVARGFEAALSANARGQQVCGQLHSVAGQLRHEDARLTR